MWSVSSSLVVVFYNIMSYVVAIQFILLCIKGWLIFIFNILQIQTVWLSEISSTTSNVIENQTQMGIFCIVLITTSQLHNLTSCLMHTYRIYSRRNVNMSLLDAINTFNCLMFLSTLLSSRLFNLLRHNNIF